MSVILSITLPLNEPLNLLYEPVKLISPVIPTLPVYGNGSPAFKANEAVVANEALIALSAFTAWDALVAVVAEPAVVAESATKACDAEVAVVATLALSAFTTLFTVILNVDASPLVNVI